MKSLSLFTALSVTTASIASAEAKPDLASSQNALGLDLIKQLDYAKENICLSPYSIQSAMLMTHNGAAGDTLTEFQKVLHLQNGSSKQYNSLHQAYQKRLIARLGKKNPEYVTSSPITFRVANRLFGANSYPFNDNFLNVCKNSYDAPLELLDFKADPNAARLHINNWVEKQTEKKIKDLLPADSIRKDTRLVLTNAIYLNAPWKKPFSKYLTKDKTFTTASGETKQVPTMHQSFKYGYKKAENYQALTIPYGHYGELEFLIILPNKDSSLKEVVKSLNTQQLTGLHNLPRQNVKLALPKFKLTSESISLKQNFQKLGMVKAFDVKQADFTKMAKEGTPPDQQLYISDVFHKTFIALDEKGTEAAAATAVVMEAKGADIEAEKIIYFTVDRPFFFAIQDAKTGNSLFIGTITDPSK